MIGLGRMGEGMSRRLIAAGHVVHGYRKNYEKSSEQYEKGYISGCTTSIKYLVDVIKSKEVFGIESGENVSVETPGVFMMVVPAETVEDTLNELLQYCVAGDIIIDHDKQQIVFQDDEQLEQFHELWGYEPDEQSFATHDKTMYEIKDYNWKDWYNKIFPSKSIYEFPNNFHFTY